MAYMSKSEQQQWNKFFIFKNSKVKKKKLQLSAEHGTSEITVHPVIATSEFNSEYTGFHCNSAYACQAMHIY